MVQDMKVKLEISLSDNDYERILLLKNREKREYMSDSEFAAQLLSELLRERWPKMTEQVGPDLLKNEQKKPV